MRLTSDRVLRALSRFDSAGSREVADALGTIQQRDVWVKLQGLVAEGFASRSGARGNIRYAVTEAGRMKLVDETRPVIGGATPPRVTS